MLSSLLWYATNATSMCKKNVVTVEAKQLFIELQNVSAGRVGLHNSKGIKHRTHKSLGELRIFRERGKHLNIYSDGSWNGFQLMEAKSCSFSCHKVEGAAYSRFLLRLWPLAVAPRKNYQFYLSCPADAQLCNLCWLQVAWNLWVPIPNREWLSCEGRLTAKQQALVGLLAGNFAWFSWSWYIYVARLEMRIDAS